MDGRNATPLSCECEVKIKKSRVRNGKEKKGNESGGGKREGER